MGDGTPGNHVCTQAVFYVWLVFPLISIEYIQGLGHGSNPYLSYSLQVFERIIKATKTENEHTA